MTGTRILFLVGVLLLTAGMIFGADNLGISAARGTRSHETAEGGYHTYSFSGINATFMTDFAKGLFASSNVGLLEKADELAENRALAGDMLVGARYGSEWDNTGFHFGAGVNSGLESYRFGNNGQSSTLFSLGVGASGGVTYYLTDSVGLFLHLQAGFSPITSDTRRNRRASTPESVNSVLFQGGMQF
ncbi:MAG: hypothetical protein ACLFM0_01965 [Spirochaetales bacterium]